MWVTSKILLKGNCTLKGGDIGGGGRGGVVTYSVIEDEIGQHLGPTTEWQALAQFQRSCHVAYRCQYGGGLGF